MAFFFFLSQICESLLKFMMQHNMVQLMFKVVMPLYFTTLLRGLCLLKISLRNVKHVSKHLQILIYYFVTFARIEE